MDVESSYCYHCRHCCRLFSVVYVLLFIVAIHTVAIQRVAIHVVAVDITVVLVVAMVVAVVVIVRRINNASRLQQ